MEVELEAAEMGFANSRDQQKASAHGWAYEGDPGGAYPLPVGNASKSPRSETLMACGSLASRGSVVFV